MGKNKLAKFEQMAAFPHVLQPSIETLRTEGFALRGRWAETFFRNPHPLTLELGCGRGEYATGLARLCPDGNFIGVDVKGARMWHGARESLLAGLPNVAFLRCRIELLPAFFAPEEVSEIWLTFPDPQMKKPSKRLTSAGFLTLYRSLLSPNGRIHLKTDSSFLYAYTLALLRANRLPMHCATDDLSLSHPNDPVLSIPTAYERQWRERGIRIHYLCFTLEGAERLEEPGVEIPWDAYRSFNRSKRSAQTSGR
ncbi:MAG: tRNA (guanosine(46)-N7)-methyltransferase TrmB [Tannerellaceae bacterium]|jgi:tRNA (guanine-N7-)-methyltransferase|nr:tRNA (guanosine(46)-N7)-methyltransferase TrmB [Tannerellaceae bacterium]